MSRIQHIWLRGKAFTAFVLLVMALMRLIWIQLREYPPELVPRSAIAIESLSLKSLPNCKLGQLKDKEGRHLSSSLEEAQRSWLLSPGFALLAKESCKKAVFHHRSFVTLNQNMLALTVFLAVVASRFLTGGWMMPLVIAVALLSRGRMITSIGTISPDLLVTCLTTLYSLFMIHFIRTGWKASIGLSLVASFLLGAAEPSLYTVSIAIPIIIAFWRAVFLAPASHDGELGLEQYRSNSLFSLWGRLRTRLGMHRFSEFYQGSEEEQARPFTPLTMPFSCWILFHKRWLFLGLVSLVCGIIILYTGGRVSGLFPLLSTFRPESILIGPLNAPVMTWVTALRSPLDIDLICAIASISIGIISPRDKCLPGYTDVCASIAMLLGIVILGSFFFDLLDINYLKELSSHRVWIEGFRAPKIFIWFEPILITLGILGVLNIINLFDAFLSRK